MKYLVIGLACASLAVCAIIIGYMWSVILNAFFQALVRG